MSRHQLNRIDLLERYFDEEYVHFSDLACFWDGVLTAIWDAANEHCPKEHVRAMLNSFQEQVKRLALPAPSQRAR